MSDAQIRTYWDADGKFSVSHEQVLEVIRGAGPQGLTNFEVFDIMTEGFQFRDEDHRYTIHRQVDGRCSDLYRELGWLDILSKEKHYFPSGKYSWRSRYTARTIKGPRIGRRCEEHLVKIKELEERLRVAEAAFVELGDRYEQLKAYLTSPARAD